MKSSILTIANFRILVGKPNKHFLLFSYFANLNKTSININQKFSNII